MEDSLSQYLPVMRKVAAQHVQPQDVEDCVQDAVIDVLRNPPQQVESLQAWLCGIVRHKAIKKFHRSQRTVFLDATIWDLMVHQGPLAQQELIREETCETMRAHVARLPIKLRSAVLLWMQDGKSNGSVHNNLVWRAKQALAKSRELKGLLV